MDRLGECCEERIQFFIKRRHKKSFSSLTVNSYPSAVTVHNTEIEQDSSYKYLGIYVNVASSWSAHNRLLQ